MRGESLLEKGRMRETQEAEVGSNGVMKGAGRRGRWEGPCRCEGDVLTSRQDDQ